MTTDTKRALEIIKPMAAEFHIQVDADDDHLYIEDPYLGKRRIGISFNSTYATLKEFIGVLIYRYDFDRNINLSSYQKSVIEKYWYNHAESEGAEQRQERSRHAEDIS